MLYLSDKTSQKRSESIGVSNGKVTGIIDNGREVCPFLSFDPSSASPINYGFNLFIYFKYPKAD